MLARMNSLVTEEVLLRHDLWGADSLKLPMCLKLTGDRKLTRFLKLTHLDVVDGPDVVHEEHPPPRNLQWDYT